MRFLALITPLLVIAMFSQESLIAFVALGVSLSVPVGALGLWAARGFHREWGLKHTYEIEFPSFDRPLVQGYFARRELEMTQGEDCHVRIRVIRNDGIGCLTKLEFRFQAKDGSDWQERDTRSPVLPKEIFEWARLDGQDVLIPLGMDKVRFPGYANVEISYDPPKTFFGKDQYFTLRVDALRPCKGLLSLRGKDREGMDRITKAPFRITPAPRAADTADSRSPAV